MKVLLLQDVKGTGKKEQIVDVNDGFARNFLFPRKLAREASAGAVRDVEHKKELERKKALEEAKAAMELANKLKKLTVKVQARCGENGRLFGAVTAKEIADALSKQHSVTVDRRKINLTEPIRQLGTVKVEVRLTAEAVANMQVEVVPQG